MSIKSFEKSVEQHVKDFINKILPDTKKELDIALAVCNGLKKFTDSPVADVVAALIPGTVDDTILAKVRAVLPTVLVDLRLADTEANKTSDQIIADGAGEIQKLAPSVKGVQLQSVWQLLSAAINTGGLSLPDLQKVGQSYYETFGTTVAASK